MGRGFSGPLKEQAGYGVGNAGQVRICCSAMGSLSIFLAQLWGGGAVTCPSLEGRHRRGMSAGAGLNGRVIWALQRFQCEVCQ
jgi:hypothetical protein